jgi:signal transduction histidine kinase
MLTRVVGFESKVDLAVLNCWKMRRPGPMSLRRRLAIQLAAMLLGAIGISAAALWGINGLQQDYGVALAGYSELRQVYASVGAQLAMAAEMLRADPPNRERAAYELHRALDQFELFTSSDVQGPNHAIRDEAAEHDIHDALLAAASELQSPISADADLSERVRRDSALVDAALVRTGTFASHISNAIEQRQASAIHRRHVTILALAGIGAVAVLGAGIIALVQYRSVVRPLASLGLGVQRIATGEFRSRLRQVGPRELQQLARDFNRMAAELDEFYHRLEEKVAEKSRELTRNERLASVGYLAAGVAHEINNPIAIIAGHAELLLSQISRRTGSHEDEETERSLSVICDEAFRCKDIVGKLLALSRPREANPGEIDLAVAAQEVIAALGGLREYQDRRIVLTRSEEAHLAVSAVAAEMKQVILNLLMNSLQSIQPGGEVRVDVSRQGELIQLRVCDDGRGMSHSTLERVFEPFYTERAGTREPGTGLGLSITHAIVQSHGGRITAASAGTGRGSEFVVELPAAQRVHA